MQIFNCLADNFLKLPYFKSERDLFYFLLLNCNLFYFKAREKHYHPHCSRCAKCGDMFGEGEEMYLQGSEIWHPHCSEEYQREVSLVACHRAHFLPLIQQ